MFTNSPFSLTALEKRFLHRLLPPLAGALLAACAIFLWISQEQLKRTRMAYGSCSRDLAAQQASQNQPQETYEMVFEWSYQIALNQWLTVQPDVQYIVNPGATNTSQNAWVIGAIVNVSF